MQTVCVTGARPLQIGLAASLCSLFLTVPTFRVAAQTVPPATDTIRDDMQAKPASQAAALATYVVRKAKRQDAKPAPQDTTPAPQDAKPQTPPSKPAEGQPQQTPPAPAVPASVPPGTFTYSGLIDVYFGINVRAPRAANGGPFTATVTPSGESIGIDNAGRAFDINDRELSLSLAELTFTRTEGKGIPFAITGTLTTGDTARLVHATEPGGTSSWQNIQQLYLSKTIHAANRDLTFDFGKFVTPIGQEVIESTGNDNYSRGFVFQYATPLYHAGLRATVPLDAKGRFTAMFLAVNGWNNVADDNDQKSFGVGLTWKPDSHFTGIFNYLGGAEGTGAYGPALAPKNRGNISTQLAEFAPTWQMNPKLKLAGDIVYANGTGDVSGIHMSGDWLGLAAYARYQLTPKFAVAVRAEQFEDLPGAGGVGLRLGGSYTKLRSGTVTLEYALLHSHVITRLEYRHDQSSSASFFGAGSGNTTPDQDTLTGSAAYKF